MGKGRWALGAPPGYSSRKGKKDMNPRKWLCGIFALELIGFAAGCGAGNTTMQTVQPESGTIFVSGSDAPLPSVVSFKVDISGIAVAEGMGTPVTVTTGPQTVDFAKLNGLHTLLDLNTIPAGTYDTVIVTLASPEIDYLNVTNPQTNPPTRPTISSYTSTTTPPATLSTSTVTIQSEQPAGRKPKRRHWFGVRIRHPEIAGGRYDRPDYGGREPDSTCKGDYAKRCGCVHR